MGLVERGHADHIVELKIQLVMLGVAQQSLEEIEYPSKKFEKGQTSHDENSRCWCLKTNLIYFIELGEKYVVKTGAFKQVSLPFGVCGCAWEVSCSWPEVEVLKGTR